MDTDPRIAADTPISKSGQHSLDAFIGALRIDINNPTHHAVFIAVLSVMLLFTNLHLGDLSGYDDAAYAHEAKIILQTGDWWTMRLNGYPDFDKPPLFIWLEATSLWCFGKTDFAAKLPSALLGFATILLIYALTRELVSDRWTPVLAMMVLMSTQHFLKMSTHAMTCVPFTFLFTLAIYFYIKASKRPSYWIWCGAAVGLATLIRSPLSLLIVIIIATHLVLSRRWRMILTRQAIYGFALALALPMPWYVREYSLFGGEFITQHFANIANHTVSFQPKSPWHRAAWYFEYVYLLLKLYWPWFPLLCLGMYTACRKAVSERDQISGLLVTWVLCVVVAFSLAESKVLRYILPAFPAFSILSALALRGILTSARMPKFFRIAYPLLLALALVTIFFPNYRVRAADMRTLAPIAERATKVDEKLLLYTSGEHKWDYRNQLIWYGDRLCTHLKSLDEIETRLDSGARTVAILDRDAFNKLVARRKVHFEVLGESDNFICIRSAVETLRHRHWRAADRTVRSEGLLPVRGWPRGLPD